MSFLEHLDELRKRIIHICLGIAAGVVIGFFYIDKIFSFLMAPAKAALFNSGAEAVENAVKIARRATGRPAVIAFDPGFHGRTLLALTLTSKVSPYKDGFGPFAPEVYRFPLADVARPIEAFHRFLKSTVSPASVACAIIEPVMGEGGFIVPPRAFVEEAAHVR